MEKRCLGAFVVGMSFVVACGDSGSGNPTTDAGADGTTANDAANDVASDVASDVVAVDAAVDSGVCDVDAGLTVCGPRCVDRATSTTDCGTCNKACAKNETCSAGACTCGIGMVQCPKTGCQNLATSLTDCGQCDKPCTNGTCSSATCTCNVGFVACNPDGCQDTATSVTDCGQCNHACGVNKTCVGGNCQ
jgi:hypothetical protein